MAFLQLSLFINHSSTPLTSLTSISFSSLELESAICLLAYILVPVVQFILINPEGVQLFFK